MFPCSDVVAFHLTPRGWRSGDVQRDGLPFLFRPAPLDRVLSLLYTSIIDSDGYRAQNCREIWRSLDKPQVLLLLIRYGAASGHMPVS